MSEPITFAPSNEDSSQASAPPDSTTSSPVSTPSTEGSTEAKTVPVEAPSFDLNSFLSGKSAETGTKNPLDAPVDDLAVQLGHASQITSQPQPQPGGRDLTGVPPQHHEVAKQMSNAAFGVFKTTLKNYDEVKAELDRVRTELATVQDARWTDHEEAYQLTPEYRSGINSLISVRNRLNHWQEQLVKIQQGENWEDIETNEKGEVSLVTYKPSEASQAHVLANLTKDQVTAETLQRTLQELPSRFKGQTQKVNTYLKQLDADLFGKVDFKPYQPRLDAVLSEVPAYLRGRMEYQLLAKCAVAMTELLRTQQQQSAVTSKVQNAVRTQGPGGSATAGGQAAVAPSGDDIMRDFNRAMGRQI